MMVFSRFSERKTRFLNRWYARRSRRIKPAHIRFLATPEPRTIGSFNRGRQLVSGDFLLAGQRITQEQADVWRLANLTEHGKSELQGFNWLDDLAAVGDGGASEVARIWLGEWIKAFGRGRGPGWTPELTGRRLLRWISHADFLLRGTDSGFKDTFFTSLQRQTYFLRKRWYAAPAGLARFEALTGLLYAGLTLEGHRNVAVSAISALGQECHAQIDAQGGVPSRNPEELLQIFALLTWSSGLMEGVGETPSEAQLAAIERIVPTLRSLRHADGGLARFHGGGRGPEGWLDHALASAGVKTTASEGLSMGYARLFAGRTSIVIDAAPPPGGLASRTAHASTLAFELTSGRRPLVVNCGSGKAFGADWRQAGRATPSHSTLSLEGYSSARLAGRGPVSGPQNLIERPEKVPVQMSELDDGLQFQGGHDGYVKSHGLMHARTLELAFDGRGITGEDMLLALEEADHKRFDEVQAAAQDGLLDYDIRFHLHPDVDASIDNDGASVVMALRSGEIWVFHHDGTHQLSLEPSVYLESDRLEPRAAKQIVLSGKAVSYASRVRWSLAKAQDTAIGIRDLSRDDDYAIEAEADHHAADTDPTE